MSVYRSIILLCRIVVVAVAVPRRVLYTSKYVKVGAPSGIDVLSQVGASGPRWLRSYDCSATSFLGQG